MSRFKIVCFISINQFRAPSSFALSDTLFSCSWHFEIFETLEWSINFALAGFIAKNTWPHGMLPGSGDMQPCAYDIHGSTYRSVNDKQIRDLVPYRLSWGEFKGRSEFHEGVINHEALAIFSTACYFLSCCWPLFESLLISLEDLLKNQGRQDRIPALFIHMVFK
jgi:hypothetical protein